MSHAIHIRLLGPIRIDGAAEQPPSDRSHALLELAAWMSLHPDGAYGCQIDRDLVWSPSSRLSALSRLRRWLGPDALPRPEVGTPTGCTWSQTGLSPPPQSSTAGASSGPASQPMPS